MSRAPPFELQLLVASVLSTPLPPERTVKRVVTCAVSSEREIFVGCYDGSLLRFSLPELDGGLVESYMLLTRASTPNNTPVDEIHLILNWGRILVVTEQRGYFYSFPALDPISTDLTLKSVLSACLDERTPPIATRPNQVPSGELCVLKPAGLALFTIREKVQYRKELPLNSKPRLLRRSGRYACLADNEHYSMIDIEAGVMIPCVPVGNEDSSPNISVISEDIFMITQWNGVTTLGIFMKGTGDPDHGRLLEYQELVLSTGVGVTNIVALLASGTVQINHIDSLEVIQTISPPNKMPPPLSVTNNRTGTLAPSTIRQSRIQKITCSLPSLISAGQNRSRPDTRRNESRARALITFSRSRILIHGRNSLHTLVARSRITQAEELIDAHRLEECGQLLESWGRTSDDPIEAEELHYLQQRLGYRCLTSCLFEDAGLWLFRGELDPRVIITHFTDLVGSVLEGTTPVQIYAGMEAHIPSTSIEDLIRNYSPHLSPNTRSAPTTSELRTIKGEQARTMLSDFLRKWHMKLRYQEVNEETPFISKAVDTVFLRLLTEAESTQDLMSFIGQSKTIVLRDLESTLIRCGQYKALCVLYERDRLDAKLVGAWAKMVDGEWTEPDITNPLDLIFLLMRETKDESLLPKWRVWLVTKDVERGMELLISRSLSSKQPISIAEERELLSQLDKANPMAGVRYLEYLVLQRKVKDVELNTRLSQHLISNLSEELKLPEVRRQVEDAHEFCKASQDAEALLSLLNAPFATAYRVAKLKVLLFLQASTLYDAELVLNSLLRSPATHLMLYERAVVFGKLHRHDDALTVFVKDLRDSAAAELYCTQSGEVVAFHYLGRIQLSNEESIHLSTILAYVSSKWKRKSQITADGLDKTLVSKLLHVYLKNPAHSQPQVERLLSAQASYFDAQEILPKIPPMWSLRSIAPFVEQGIRADVHRQYESQVVKALSFEQNLTVAQSSYEAFEDYFAKQGKMIEEEDDDDEVGADAATSLGTSYQEKVPIDGEYSEKSPLVEEIRPKDIRGLDTR